MPTKAISAREGVDPAQYRQEPLIEMKAGPAQNPWEPARLPRSSKQEKKIVGQAF